MAKPDDRKLGVRPYGAESRILILAAAQKLFAHRGLHDVSMHDIAAEAGLSRATVFNQFGSKSLILDAITARSLSTYGDLLRAALADEATPAPQMLRRLFAQMAAGLEANRELYREVFAEIRKMSMGLGPEGLSPQLHRDAFGLLVAILQRGQERGELAHTHPPEVLATAFDSLLNGAVNHWLATPPGAPLAPILASLVEVLLTGVQKRT